MSGDYPKTIRVPLGGWRTPAQGYALIDVRDAEMMFGYRWSLASTGYVRAMGPSGVIVQMHRLVMGCVPGDGKIVDHINHDKLDNRRSNLRLVTAYENAQNRNPELGPCGAVTTRGIAWDSKRARYRARAFSGGRVFDAGYHADLDEAKAALVALRASLGLP